MRRKYKLIIFFTFLYMMLFISPIAMAASEEEEYPEGMTESEKQQMLDEMYEDIEQNEEFVPDENSDAPDETDDEDLDGDLMTDEEAAEKLLEALPSAEELSDFSKGFSDQVMIVPGVTTGYDKSKHLYHYTFKSGYGLNISVPVGTISTYAVTTYPDKNIQILSVYKDGERVTSAQGNNGEYIFREPGLYEMLVADSRDSKATWSCSFRIIDEMTPISQTFFPAPEGFVVRSIFVNGQQQPVMDNRFARIYKDGNVEIIFEAKDSSNSLPLYKVNFRVDTTAPYILFDGDIRNGTFNGEIIYDCDDKDANVSIFFNGQPAISNNHVLATAGNYFITVSDKTGNSRSYNFIILRQGKIPWIGVIVFLAIAAIASIFVVVTAKGNMKIN